MMLLSIALRLLLAAEPALSAAAPAPIPAPGAAIAPGGPTAPAAAPAARPPTLGPIRFDPARGRYVAPYGDGLAVLTLDPRLQRRLERTLAEQEVPWGVTVLLDPRTGRVLAMAEHAQGDPKARWLSLRARAPAASIFKIVTASALLEDGASPEEPVCYHGGQHRLAPALLADDARRDRSCLSMAAAFGLSANVVFAKLAARALSPERLRAAAARLLFDAPIPFPAPVEPSHAVIPSDRFGLASAAAGFGEVRLSPLHAALLAAVVANHGMLAPPWLVELVEGGQAPPVGEPVRLLDAPVAAELGAMMRETVAIGTARRAFSRAPRELRGVTVAGKTGSLDEQRPFRDNTWFVGYAPADDPQVVVATLVVNGPLWRVRAPWVAREALAAYFADHLADAAPPAALRLASWQGAGR